MMLNIFIAILLVAFANGQGQARLRFAARGLPDKDPVIGTGTTDPYLTLCVGDGIDWIDCGYETETIDDEENPDWSTTFIIPYDSANPMFLVNVADSDYGVEDWIGSKIFSYNELAGGIYQAHLTPSGNGQIIVTKF